jgi:glycosyltransferase involved in cell wall biosynthesis
VPSEIPHPVATARRFTVIVPTRGHETTLARLLASLEAQTFPRDRWDLVVAFDGVAPTDPSRARLERLRAAIVALPARRGPGAARNEAARRAAGEFLAFTEDDCEASPDWLESADARLRAEPALDVLEGGTFLETGRPVRRRRGESPTWLPTNLFVRRDLFERVGGYCEEFFDAERGIYFREDSDFGFTLVAAGARVASDARPRVTHPREHTGWLDPVRWARRYEMDPLLARRHPRAFREEIEVVALGPFRIRRPFVRACAAYAISLAACVAATALGEPGVASWFAATAILSLLAVWSKWGFAPARLPLMPVVPLILLGSLARGGRRARRAREERPRPS